MASFVTTGTLDASLANIININASNINVGVLNAGLITAGVLRGIQIQEVSDTGALLADLYKNSNGGILDILDIYGNLNAHIGAESGAGANIGGTIKLYNDSIVNPRVELGIDKVYDAGAINLKGSNGIARVAIYAGSSVGNGLFVLNSSGTVKSYITETSGRINNYEIATQSWVNNNALTASGDYVYLPNGCYLECLSGRLILHANSTNYISVGSGTMIVVEDGASRPV